MTEPLTHARILYDSIGDRGTITASAALTGFPASAAGSPLTYSFWSAGLPATWQVDLDEAEMVNAWGIAAHTLLSNNAMAVLQAWIDGAWQTLPSLIPVGDLWPFDEDLFGKRGAAYGTTVGTLRRGVGVDGYPLVTGGTMDSKFGRSSLTVEPAIANLFPANARSGGDKEGDLTDFDGGSDATYSTNQAASGVGSVLVTAGGGSAVLQTDPVSISAATEYTAQARALLFFIGDASQVNVAVYGDVSGAIANADFDLGTELDGDAWELVSLTFTTGGGDSTVYIVFTIDDGAAYIDELQLETGDIAHSWINGSQAAGDLGYQAEILQQFSGDCTVNLWLKVTGPPSIPRWVLHAADGSGDNEVALLITGVVNPTMVLSTTDRTGSDTTGHEFVGDGAWRMFTFVLEPGSSRHSIYLNGSLVNSESATHFPDWQQLSVFSVGHKAGGSYLGTDGAFLLDDMAIINRAAGADEIAAWYAAGEAMGLTTAGLAYHDDDRPIVGLVEAETNRRFRIRIVGQSTPKVGHIKIGKTLEMTRPLYGGNSPIGMARSTVIRPTTSDGGQFLGRSIIRSGTPGSWSWTNLEANWVREKIDPFLRAALTGTFFILWRPSSFPGEAGYLWTLGDPRPVNIGQANLMSFNLDAVGLGVD